jgi:hypothetical protein
LATALVAVCLLLPVHPVEQAHAATPYDPAPDGSDSGRYYALIGRDNFRSGLDCGLLETRIEVPASLRTFFAGSPHTITFDRFFRLFGLDEQDYATLQQADCPAFAALTVTDWDALKAWVVKQKPPRDSDGDGYADNDGYTDNTATREAPDGIISIDEQNATIDDTGQRHVLKTAFAMNTVYIGPNPPEPFSPASPVRSGNAYLPPSIPQVAAGGGASSPIWETTKGYDRLDSPAGAAVANKFVDYQLTDANRVTIPARFNRERDDILITFRSHPGYSLGDNNFRPASYLNVLDAQTGSQLASDTVSPQLYMNGTIAGHLAQTHRFANPNDGYWGLRNGTIRNQLYKWSSNVTTYTGGGLGGKYVLKGTYYGGSNPHVSAHESHVNLYDMQMELHGAWSTAHGGTGAQQQLRGFYRRGIGGTATDIGDDPSTWTAADDIRRASAQATIAVQSGITNVNYGGRLATGIEAHLWVQVTRPTLTTDGPGQSRAVTWRAGSGDFDTSVGGASVTVCDAGVAPAVARRDDPVDGDVAGGVDYVGTRNAADRMVVYLREQPAVASTPWTGTEPGYNLGDGADVAALTARLDGCADGTVLQLLYTYAAADADTALVGEIPGDVGALDVEGERNRGAYATPLLRTVTVQAPANAPTPPPAGPDEPFTPATRPVPPQLPERPTHTPPTAKRPTRADTHVPTGEAGRWAIPAGVLGIAAAVCIVLFLKRTDD